jgi:hypothetical protein
VHRDPHSRAISFRSVRALSNSGSLFFLMCLSIAERSAEWDVRGAVASRSNLPRTSMSGCRWYFLNPSSVVQQYVRVATLRVGWHERSHSDPGTQITGFTLNITPAPRVRKLGKCPVSLRELLLLDATRQESEE